MSTAAGEQGALEQATASCARLIDALRVCNAPDALLGEIGAQLEQAAEQLLPWARPGPHAQARSDMDPRDFFERHVLAPHEVMPYSPIIGRLNAVSPRLLFEAQGPRITGSGTIPVRFVGAPQTAHGGYVAAILDELMGMVLFHNGQGAFTGTLDVRYHRPTPIERELALSAEFTGGEGRKLRARAEIHCDGQLTASAEGLFIRPKSPQTFSGSDAG